MEPILKKYFVGLRSRGRGCRTQEPSWSRKLTCYGKEIHDYIYQSYLPLDKSDKVAFYIRVEPTEKFLKRYRGDKRPSGDIIFNFNVMVCPIIRQEILQRLEDFGIEPIRK